MLKTLVAFMILAPTFANADEGWVPPSQFETEWSAALAAVMPGQSVIGCGVVNSMAAQAVTTQCSWIAPDGRDVGYRVKVGVAGLPKRVIIQGFGYLQNHGRGYLTSVINAIRTYRGLPTPSVAEIDILIKAGRLDDMTLKVFGNGNGHLSFGPEALLDINRALAEFYGDVLADTPDERPAKRMSTSVSKDLQFYPTPSPVAAGIVHGMSRLQGASVLEPSCGDGRLMQAVLKAGAGRVVGVEVDAGRVEEARRQGLSVVHGNFLDMVADATFDFVLMNPPFYGTHYAKHVSHACRFLKPGGQLIAILPVTARTDHGLLTKDWAAAHGMRLDGFQDLPVGSFAESGTNINTTVLRATKRT